MPGMSKKAFEFQPVGGGKIIQHPVDLGKVFPWNPGPVMAGVNFDKKPNLVVQAHFPHRQDSLRYRPGYSG